MPPLRHKKIVLGITGSIAAYKAALLTRLLIKNGAEVRVLMTHSASEFIAPLTLATLSKNDVHADMTTDAAWNNHVELGMWADLILIAPATANTLSKMAHGACDNILTATILSAKCPVVVAPAMDLDMWKHPSMRRNLNMLISDGVSIIPVGDGELASGLFGEGRMAEPEEIVQYIEAYISRSHILKDRRVLLTVGPTHEKIDPVRFIGNRSSGKMGVALSQSLVAAGARVTMVLGPISDSLEIDPEIEVIRVTSAEEMYRAALSSYDGIDIAIFAAAVADYKVANPADEKMKKSEDQLQIILSPNPDIAAELGKIKKRGAIHMGFALETSAGGIALAADKLKKKNFDLIALNYPTRDSGFHTDTNRVTLIDHAGVVEELPLMSKKESAEYIITRLASFFQ